MYNFIILSKLKKKKQKTCGLLKITHLRKFCQMGQVGISKSCLQSQLFYEHHLIIK